MKQSRAILLMIVPLCALVFATTAHFGSTAGLKGSELPVKMKERHGVAPGDLDASFGNHGIVITHVSEDPISFDFAYAAALQSDGKIVSIGNNVGIAVTRHNTDGSLDDSFGSSGFVLTPIGSSVYGNAVAIQSDGRIVVAATAIVNNFYDFVIIRYNSDGALDNSFGTGGKVFTAIGTSDDIPWALAIQSDGKIVAAGYTYSMNTDFAVVRYNQDGTIDNTFGTGGKVITQFGVGAESINEMVIQPDGKIVAAGIARIANLEPYGFALARYNVDGSLDSTFGEDGRVLTTIGNGSGAVSVALQPDGKIVAGGSAGGDFALARYIGDGSLDTSFDTDGTVTIPVQSSSLDSGNDLAIQENGKIILTGTTLITSGSTSRDFALIRCHADGTLDQSFGTAGKVITVLSNMNDFAHEVLLQSDGKIVVVGTTVQADADFALVRYLGDPIAPRDAKFDYDGDGRSDISVFRPSTGAWYLQQSAAGFIGVNFGSAEDKIVPADYDGDGKTDVAVYRPSTGIWYVSNSSNGTFSYYNFGIAEDLPAPADYDGDGKADICVFRASTGTWYRQNSSNGEYLAVQFGAIGDRPTVGDFDGDGKSDIAVFRPSTGAWYQINSSNGTFFGEQFGIATDKSAPADYDGDGKTDIAIYRPAEGLWYIKNSATSTYTPYVFGLAEDISVPGDFDGDGKADIAVFRPSDGTWYIVNSSNSSYTIFQFGQNGDRPTQSAFGN